MYVIVIESAGKSTGVVKCLIYQVSQVKYRHLQLNPFIYFYIALSDLCIIDTLLRSFLESRFRISIAVSSEMSMVSIIVNKMKSDRAKSGVKVGTTDKLIHKCSAQIVRGIYYFLFSVQP